MSYKTQRKHELRKARQRDPSAVKPAYLFHSRFAGMTAEEIHRELAIQNARSPLKSAPRPQTYERRQSSLRKNGAREVVLTESEAKSEIQEGSLRAAVIEALRAGRGTMTMDELSAALKRDARPIVAKLEFKGWVRTSEPQQP